MQHLLVMRIGALALVLLVTSAASARDDGRGQSIMFDQEYKHLTEKPEQADSRTQRCEELSRQIESLKGRPQRRFTAVQRYEAECKDVR